jgi:hypothetical protein
MTEQGQGMLSIELAELLTTLAKARVLAEQADLLAEGNRALAMKTPEWNAYVVAKAGADGLSGQVTELQTTIRGQSLALARLAGKTALPRGVEVVSRTTFEITDRPAATAWAKVNMPLTMTLDAQAFEKAVKALPEPEQQTVPGTFLATNELGQVRISNKLTELYLVMPKDEPPTA